jgi:hypothetical protein
MNFVRYEALAQILGMIGVIASLVFVGIQIKQSRDIALADIYQQRSAMQLDLALSHYSPEQVAVVIGKMISDRTTITKEDYYVIGAVMSASYVYYENIHFQHQLGMITEEEWVATKKLMLNDLAGAPCALRMWETERGLVRESFASEVDNLLLQLKLPPCDIPWLQGPSP